jgi:hypothetical protein
MRVALELMSHSARELHTHPGRDAGPGRSGGEDAARLVPEDGRWSKVKKFSKSSARSRGLFDVTTSEHHWLHRSHYLGQKGPPTASADITNSYGHVPRNLSTGGAVSAPRTVASVHCASSPRAGLIKLLEQSSSAYCSHARAWLARAVRDRSAVDVLRRHAVGKLVYGSSSRELELADRTLAHVKAVTVMKLRRNESFTVSWQRAVDGGGGRVSIWVHPSIPLQFEFEEELRPELNRAWLEALMQDANRTGDLRIAEELPPKAARVGGTSQV